MRLRLLEDDLEASSLRRLGGRLRSLLTTLAVESVEPYVPLLLLADFAASIADYSKGFTVVTQPWDERTPTVHDPLLQV